MTKKEELKRAYTKERRRINNYISRKKREGYNIEYVIPKIPKKITVASVNRLKKITPQLILSKQSDSVKKQIAINKSLKAVIIKQKKELSGLNKKRKKQSGKFKKSDGTILKSDSSGEPVQSIGDSIEEVFSDFTIEDFYITSYRRELKDWNEAFENYMNSLLNIWIERYGKNNVGRMLEEANNAGYIITREIAYNIDGALYIYTAALLDYIPTAQTEKDNFIKLASELMNDG